MAIFLGTNAAETITPELVSPTVMVNGSLARPSDARDIIQAGGGADTIDSGGGNDMSRAGRATTALI